MFINQQILQPIPRASKTDLRCLEEAEKSLIHQIISEIDGCKGIVVEFEPRLEYKAVNTEEIKEVTNFIDTLNWCFAKCLQGLFPKIYCMNDCFTKYYPALLKLSGNASFPMDEQDILLSQARNETLQCVESTMDNGEDRERDLLDAKEYCKLYFE